MVDENMTNPSEIESKHSGYFPISKINGGGMADIHLGVQYRRHTFERFVAIKQIRGGGPVEHQKSGAILDEAKLGARLTHPNIAQMLDLTEDDGKKAIIMEYVQGENLRYIIKAMNQRKKQIPLALACSLVIQACEALEYTHNLKLATGRHLRIVHRDIDPGNLMLASNGYLKMVDFGIAANAEQQTLTAPGFRKGKLAYIAPENFEKGQVDKRGDIYSLGLVFFELLTGRKARKIGLETKPTAAFRAISEKVSLTPFLKGRFPKGLAEMVNRATRHDPNKRFQSAAEFGAAIRSYARQHAEVLTPMEIKAWFDVEFPEVATRCKNREVVALNRLKAHAAYLNDPRRVSQQSQDHLLSANLDQKRDIEEQGETGDSEKETSLFTKPELERIVDGLFDATATANGAKPLKTCSSTVPHPPTAPSNPLRTPSPTMVQIVGVRSTLHKAMYTGAVLAVLLLSALVASWFFSVEKNMSPATEVTNTENNAIAKKQITENPNDADEQPGNSLGILLALGSVPQYQLTFPRSESASAGYDPQGSDFQLSASGMRWPDQSVSKPASGRTPEIDSTGQAGKRNVKGEKKRSRRRSDRTRNSKRKRARTRN